MKTIATENKIYEASKFNSWEEALNFIKKTLYMSNEHYEFGPGISDTPPESITLHLWDKHTNDDNDEPIFILKIFICISKKNTLKDIIELQHLLEWLNNLYTVCNDYSLDEYSILIKSKQGFNKIFKYPVSEE